MYPAALPRLNGFLRNAHVICKNSLCHMGVVPDGSDLFVVVSFYGLDNIGDCLCFAVTFFIIDRFL